MNLIDKQKQFGGMVSLLLHYATYLGYEYTLGEVERREEIREAHVAIGSHPRSTHFKKLALDLHLFKDGVYQVASEDHQKLGEFWEFLGGTWGGRFNDGNHYSLAHQGVR